MRMLTFRNKQVRKSILQSRPSIIYAVAAFAIPNSQFPIPNSQFPNTKYQIPNCLSAHGLSFPQTQFQLPLRSSVLQRNSPDVNNRYALIQNRDYGRASHKMSVLKFFQSSPTRLSRREPENVLRQLHQQRRRTGDRQPCVFGCRKTFDNKDYRAR